MHWHRLHGSIKLTGNGWENEPRLMLTLSTSQGRHLPRVFQVFGRRSSASSASGAGGMSGGSGTAYFATCITFFIDENHVARLPPKPLPVHTVVSTATHPIRESALTLLSHCQSFREISSHNSLATECIVRSYSTATFPRVAATLPFLQSAPTRFVLVVVFVCQHNHQLFLGIHSHTLWSVTY